MTTEKPKFFETMPWLRLIAVVAVWTFGAGLWVNARMNQITNVAEEIVRVKATILAHETTSDRATERLTLENGDAHKAIITQLNAMAGVQAAQATDLNWLKRYFSKDTAATPTPALMAGK